MAFFQLPQICRPEHRLCNGPTGQPGGHQQGELSRDTVPGSLIALCGGLEWTLWGSHGGCLHGDKYRKRPGLRLLQGWRELRQPRLRCAGGDKPIGFSPPPLPRKKKGNYTRKTTVVSTSWKEGPGGRAVLTSCG